MEEAGKTYGLRARTFVTNKRKREKLSKEELNQPAARATISAGLRPGTLTKAERLLFSNQYSTYLDLRSKILERWDANVGQFLTAEQCLDLKDDETALEDESALIHQVHKFLMEQGLINFGVLENEPIEEVPDTSQGPSDEELAYSLVVLLQKVDLDEWTEKRIRAELERQFNAELKDRKAFIREKVIDFLNGNRTAKKPGKGSVVVIGAGPAGLTAASHLKRCGMKVVVLEAQDRVGGRVCTKQSGTVNCKVDLGASIITGTAPDTNKGLQPDPSAIVARQLKLELFALGEQLPLFDGVTGQKVSDSQDRKIEFLRDALMDAARSRVEELGEEKVSGESFGHALNEAMKTLKAQSLKTQKSVSPEQNSKPSPQGETLLDKLKASSTFQQAKNGSESQSKEAEPQSQNTEGIKREIEQSENKDTKQKENDEGKQNLLEAVKKEGGEASESLGGKLEESEDKEKTNGSNEGLMSHMEPALEGLDAKKEEEIPSHQKMDIEMSIEGKKEEPKPIVTESLTDANGCQTPAEVLNGEVTKEDVNTIVRNLDDSDLRLLDWHWANLEYGCSARLKDVSLAHWNQDEEFGGFGGPHCMVKGGYGQITDGLAQRLDIRLNNPVSKIQARDDGVEVTTDSGEKHQGDICIVTVPLGCLKAQQIIFKPVLPPWKQEAIEKLGFGTLNKIILEFSEVFWEPKLSYFGSALPGGEAGRGKSFMFWNLFPITGEKQLIALLSGEAAYQGEDSEDKTLKDAAIKALKTLFGREKVPEPVGYVVTKWMKDEYSKGSYSFVGVGATAKTYDALAKPVHRRILFAGEHTCKEHPDTVGGAMLSGMREAVRALRNLRGDKEEITNAAAEQIGTVPAKRQRQVSTEDDSGLPTKRVKKAKGEGPGRKKRSREEIDSGDEEIMAGGNQIEKRPREAAKTAEQIQMEQIQRETSREEAKAILKAIMLISSGSNMQFLNLLDSATEPDSRAQVLYYILRASKNGLQAIAKDESSMHVLKGWIKDLLEDPQSFHVMELILTVLVALPKETEVVEESGLADIVQKQLLTHKMKQIRSLAEKLVAQWKPASSSKVAPEPTKVQQSSKEKKSTIEKALNPTSKAASPIENKSIEEEEDRDEAYEKILESLQAEREEAKRLADEYQRQAEEDPSKSEISTIVDFDSYAKTHRTNGTHKSKVSQETLARRKERAERQLAKAQKSNPELAKSTQKAGPSSSRGSVKEAIADVVKEVLQPEYTMGRLDKESFKNIMKSSVHKVISNRPPSAPSQLNEREKEKIVSLVKKYLAKQAR